MAKPTIIFSYLKKVLYIYNWIDILITKISEKIQISMDNCLDYTKTLKKKAFS